MHLLHRSWTEEIIACPGSCRYAAGDAVEAWLNGLLCLDAAEHVPRPPVRLPHPGECELYHVERDTLFSYHKARRPGIIPLTCSGCFSDHKAGRLA